MCRGIKGRPATGVGSQEHHLHRKARPNVQTPVPDGEEVRRLKGNGSVISRGCRLDAGGLEGKAFAAGSECVRQI